MLLRDSKSKQCQTITFKTEKTDSDTIEKNPKENPAENWSKLGGCR